jgi:hypothetical protein
MAETLHRAAPDAGTALDDYEQPGWRVRFDSDGELIASIAGSGPPMTVCGKDLDDLRRQIRQTVLRAML